MGDTNLLQSAKFCLQTLLPKLTLESFSSSVMGICEISLCISNITPPPSRVLSFLYTLYGQDSGNNSEVDMELSIFCLLNCHNLRLMKVKESQQLKFLTPYTIDVYAHKFQSSDKFVFI